MMWTSMSGSVNGLLAVIAGVACILTVLVAWLRGRASGAVGLALLASGTTALVGGLWLSALAHQPQTEQIAALAQRVERLQVTISEQGPAADSRLDSVETMLEQLAAAVSPHALTVLKTDLARLESERVSVQASLTDLAARLRAIQQRTGAELERLAHDVEQSDASLTTLAAVQTAVLNWGIGVSREMRERVGPLATLQMAELDRLKGRSESVQATHRVATERKPD